MRKAHLLHHKHLGPEDGECFGMLWAPYRLFKEAMTTKSNLGSLPIEMPWIEPGYAGSSEGTAMKGAKQVDKGVNLPRPGAARKTRPNS